MAEPGRERDNELDREEDYKEEEENGASSHSQLPNTPLAEINMLLVFLSSLSIDDCMEYEESEHGASDQVAGTKTCTLRSHTKKGDLHEPKLQKRSSSTRFQAWKKNVISSYCGGLNKSTKRDIKLSPSENLFSNVCLDKVIPIPSKAVDHHSEEDERRTGT